MTGALTHFFIQRITVTRTAMTSRSGTPVPMAAQTAVLSAGAVTSLGDTFLGTGNGVVFNTPASEYRIMSRIEIRSERLTLKWSCWCLLTNRANCSAGKNQQQVQTQ